MKQILFKLPLASLVLINLPLAAQSPITSVGTTTVGNAPLTRTGITASPSGPYTGTPFDVTYDGNETRVTSVQAAAQTWYPDLSLSGTAIARRSGAAATFPTSNGALDPVWNRQDSAPVLGADRTVVGQYHNTISGLLTGHNLFSGTENLMQNVDGTGTGANVVNDVERVDYLFSTGVPAQMNSSVSIFERGRGPGGGGVNGGFKLAAITGFDGSGNPTYVSSGIVSIADNSYGFLNQFTPFRSDVYREASSAGTDLDFLNNPGSSVQGLAGVLVPLTAFVPAGTTVYGYSLLGEDVSAATPAELADWTNPVFYPQNSASGNDIDLVATGVTIFRAPDVASTTVSLGLGLGGLALLSLRRTSRNRAE